MLFLIVLLALSTLGLGFIIGRVFTKWECGKMLIWLERSGALKRPFEEHDDEEDYK